MMLKSVPKVQGLTGKDAATAAKLAAFDLPTIMASSHDACDYIAQASNRGQLKIISSPKGTAIADGKTVNFVVGWAGGSCASQQIRAEGCEDDTCFKNAEMLHPFKFADEGLIIVPYHGKYYTVSSHEGAPDEVVDPNSGHVCSFEHHYKPVLIENKSPALCEKYFDGKLEHTATWTELKEDEIEKTNDINLANGYADFDRADSVSFDGKHSVRIGHFGISSTGGCGCEHNGVALLGNNKAASSDKEPQKSLIDYQGKWWHCGESDADLVQVDGITYVDALGGKIRDRKEPPRVLLQLSNGSFQPICRIDQVLTITPSESLAPNASIIDYADSNKHHKHAKKKFPLSDQAAPSNTPIFQ